MADLNDKINELTDTPDTTSEYDPADIQANKTKSIFAYLFWLVLIPIFSAKDSKFARFHANQGLILAIVETAAVIISETVGRISYIGWIFNLAVFAIDVVCTIFAVIGIVNVAKGKAKELPIIGKIKILK